MATLKWDGEDWVEKQPEGVEFDPIAFNVWTETASGIIGLTDDERRTIEAFESAQYAAYKNQFVVGNVSSGGGSW